MKKTIFLGFCLVFLFGFIHSQIHSQIVKMESTITVKSPHSGNTWWKGRTYTIQWTKTGTMDSNVKIRLRDSTSATKILDITNSTLNDGNYSWEIPTSVAPGNYRIRVRTTDKQVYGDSEAFTVIKNPLKGSQAKAVAYPVIKSAFGVPLGALKVGTKLFLKGKYFGTQPGEIQMYGNFQNSPVKFVNVNWKSNEKVNGVIPVFSSKGQLDQTVKIRVITAGKRLSNAWKMKFEGRKEEKVLHLSDVVVVHCGDDANTNWCNEEAESHRSSSAIFGFHQNAWGASENDVGDDTYQISLKNGWKFKSMEKVSWYKSSGDEVLTGPNPPFPVGESNWTTTIHWKASPYDHVYYQIKIIVEGPLGTHYK